MLLIETVQPNIHPKINPIATGWASAYIKERPIDMLCHEAPNAGPEAHETWAAGLDQKAKMVTLKEKSLEIPLTVDERLKVAINDSFGFVVLWGKRAGNSTAVACLSNGLIGFDGQDPQKQRECGVDILRRIISLDDSTEKDYGPHKRVVFIETDLDEETMLKRFVDSQAEPTYKYFPELQEEEQLLDSYRHQQLINLEPGIHRPFIDVSQGRTTPLIKAYQNNGKKYFEYGYEEREDEFIGINLDGNEQPLRELYERATLEVTGEMLRDIAKFLEGQRGKNRFVLQLDFGADAACCNMAFNAQQNVFTSQTSILSLNSWKPESEDIISDEIRLNPYILEFQRKNKNEANDSKNYCREHKMNKSECNCAKEDQPLAA